MPPLSAAVVDVINGRFALLLGVTDVTVTAADGIAIVVAVVTTVRATTVAKKEGRKYTLVDATSSGLSRLQAEFARQKSW